MSADPTDEQLHAYVDEALTPQQRAEVEAYLRANPEAAERVEAYRRQNALLRSTLDPMLDEPAPARLHGHAPRSRRAAVWMRYGGFAAALLVAGALGWFVRGETNASPEFVDALARRAVTAHLVYAPEVLHPVEVGAQQEEHLAGWLSKRMGARLRPPYLGDVGFRLVGGRLLPGEDRPAAQFMYEDTRGRRLTLYVGANAARPRDTAFRYTEKNGVSTFYWLEGRLGYALSGEIERDQLLQVAEAVYRNVSR